MLRTLGARPKLGGMGRYRCKRDRLHKLHTTFGCSGTVLDWFASYLSFRTQSDFVGHASTPSALKCGVPQGSILGPLLFTLYTQSLSTVIVNQATQCCFNF